MAQYPASFALSSLTAATGYTLRPGVDGTLYGISISSAGDVNGDGETDFLIGESDYYPRSLVTQTPTLAGQTHLVFGGAANLAAMDVLDGVADGVIDQSLLTADFGYILKYNVVGDGSGVSVEGAGQVDGVAGDDFMIGTPRSTATPGVAHFVSGGANLAVLDAADGLVDGQIALTEVDGSTGYEFTGTSNSDRNGYAVGSIGDVNNDGFRDLLVGSYMADPPGAANGGWVALVFGSPANLSQLDTAGGSPADGSISVANLDGTTGYRFVGAAQDFAGVSLAGMGDVNGDSIPDLIIGAQQNTLGGESYIVFGGSANFAALDVAGGAPADGLIALSALNGTTGYRFKTTDNDEFGWSVSGAGDVNADGVEDFLIGDAFGDAVSNNGGHAYLLFGGTANLSALDAADGLVDGSITADNVNGTTGFRLAGPGSQWVGQSVSAAGDVNGDGYDDVSIGANFRTTRTGSVYIMFGGPGGNSGFNVEDAADGVADGKINLTSFSGVGGMRIDGVTVGDQAGFDVARIGDINGDGLADMMLSGVRDQNSIPQKDTGEVYIVYSRLPDAAVNRTGTGIDQTLVGGDFDDSLFGMGGDDTLIGHGGNDLLDGGTGDDTLIGGDGTDTAVVGASWLQTTISETGPGSFLLTVGGNSVSTSGVELFQFTNGTFAASAILNDAPVATDDVNGAPLVADHGSDTASGNVLGNDSDPDAGLGDTLSVTGVRIGTEETGGSFAAVGVGTTLAGVYGDLTIGPDGAWSYALDDSDPDTIALLDETVVDSFSYGVADAKGGLVDIAQLDIVIEGVDDAPVAAPDHGYVSRGATATVAAALLLANDNDPDSAVLELQSVAAAANGTVGLNGDGDVSFTATTSISATTAGFDYFAFDGTTASMAHVSLGLVTTTAANNTLTVNTLAGQFSFIDGQGGNDRLTGGAGMDTLLGGAANDRLDGGTGADRLFGGTGNDVYFVDDPADLVREDSVAGIDDGGVDTVSSSQTYTLGNFVENLTLTGVAAIDGTGNGLANILTGNAAANSLFGGGGADSLMGGAGADTMDGGEGGDIYTVDAADIIHDTGTTGMDQVITAGTFTLTPGSGIETLSSKAGTAGAFTLIGDEGDNKVTGNIGNNTLRGLAGNDTLLGGDGDDKLTGGIGRDLMTGGNGADTFIFRNGESPAGLFDSITDYLSGIDKVDLQSVTGAGLPAGEYAETSVASNNFNDVLNAATLAMSGGDKTVVFVAGSLHGWLFWNTDANLQTPEEGVRLNFVNSAAGFDIADLV